MARQTRQQKPTTIWTIPVMLAAVLAALLAAFGLWTFTDQVIIPQVFTAAAPVTIYSSNFCSSNSSFTGGSAITSQCVFNVTGPDTGVFLHFARTCSECNISYSFNTGNFSYGDGKTFYAMTANGTFSNEYYLLSNYNATHAVFKPVPGYDFENGYIPYGTWNRVTITLSDASGLSTIYVYNSTGGLYTTFTYGSRQSKSYTTSGKYFGLDLAGFTGSFLIANVTIVDLTGEGGSPADPGGRVDITGGINFTLNNPLNGSSTNASSVLLNVTVWNMNASVTGGTSITTPVNCTMTNDSDRCGFDLGTGNGILNITGTTQGQMNGTNYTFQNFSMAIYCGVNATGFKARPSRGTGADNWLWECNATMCTVKNEDGYGTQPNDFPVGSWVNTWMSFNRSSNTSSIMWVGKSGGVSTTSAGAFNILPDNGEFQFESTYSGAECAVDNFSMTVLSSEAPTSGGTGNTTLNVSFYAANGTLLYNVSNVANGSTVTFNWSVTTNQTYNWNVSIVTERNTLRVNGLSFNKTNAAPGVTIGNISIVLVSMNTSMNVVRNQLYNFSMDIVCTNGTCGRNPAYLDPATSCGAILCGNDTYNGSGGLNGKTWAQVHEALIAPYITNPNGWTIWQTFNTGGKTVLWVPWYVYDNDMAEANLKDAYVGGTATFSMNTMVTDEASEQWMMAVMNYTFAQVQQFTNALDICYDDSSGHQAAGPWLTSWVCSRSGTTITKNDRNSASDATARLALGYWMCAQNPQLTTSERQFCRDRARNITGASIAEEWVNVCHTSPINGSVALCYWHLAGAAQAWGAGALIQNGEQMFIGYHESDIMNYLAGCAATKNMTYCDYARYETHQYLYVVGYTGGTTSADYKMRVQNKNYYMDCSVQPCVSVSQFNGGGLDDADGTRDWETCNNVRYAELTYQTIGVALPWEFGQLRNYCTAKAARIAASGSVSQGGTQLIDADNGCAQVSSTATCKVVSNSDQYREMGWLANGVALKNSTSYLASFLGGPLQYFNTANQYYTQGGGNSNPGIRGYGIYGQSRIPRAIRAHSGYYDFLFRNQTFNYSAWSGGAGSVEPPNTTTGVKNGSLVSTVIGATPVYTLGTNPIETTCQQSMTNTTCRVSWLLNFTGEIGTAMDFFAFTTSDTTNSANSSHITLTIIGADTTPPTQSAVGISLSNSSANITWTTSEPTNDTFQYGLTTSYGTTVTNASFSIDHAIRITGLQNGMKYYYLRKNCDSSGNCVNSTGNFTTLDSTPPVVTLSSPVNGYNTTSTSLTFAWTVTDNLATTLSCYIWTNHTGTWARNVTVSSAVNATITYTMNNLGNGSNKWTVECNDTRQTAFSSTNRTFFINGTTNLPGVTFCSAPNALTFDPSAGNIVGGKLTQYGVRARNQSACSCTYRLNNTLNSSVTVSTSTNYTNTSYIIRLRGSQNVSILPPDDNSGNGKRADSITARYNASGWYDFNATTQIQVPVLLNTTNGSLFARVFVKNASQSMILWGGPNAADGYGGENETHIDLQNSGGWKFHGYKNSPTGACDVMAVQNVSLNTWYSVGLTWNNTQCSLYVGGVNVANDTSVLVTSGAYGYTKTFIGSPAATTRRFNGSIDDVRIYTTTLSAADLASLHAGTLVTSGLAVAYNFSNYTSVQSLNVTVPSNFTVQPNSYACLNATMDYVNASRILPFTLAVVTVS